VDVLLVVDMQEGLLRGAPKHDLLAVVERINHLAVRVRRSGGSIFLFSTQAQLVTTLSRSRLGGTF
jgi:nicotinamidase-related amidase